MKFGQEYNHFLTTGNLPARWLETAVPYRQLKKLLKKIQAELESLGLDSATLAQLSQPSTDPNLDSDPAARKGSNVAFKYDFEGEESFSPKLTLFIDTKDGRALEARLSPATRIYLESLAERQQGASSPSKRVLGEGIEGSQTDEIPTPDHDASNLQRVEVQMNFDAEFFKILQGDVTSLDALQTEEQKKLVGKIEDLSKTVVTVAKPSTVKRLFWKSDLNRWRELFDVYSQAGIFFSTHEIDHGTRSSAAAAQKLEWFQKEIMKRGITKSFKLPESMKAFNQFIEINIGLLQSLRFLEYNELAVKKIMKKFDKRTNLGAASTFPRLIFPEVTMSGTMAKAVYTQLSQDLVQIVPPLEVHSCPVCMDICWRPIRLSCSHLLCIICTIELQKKKSSCPLCRTDCVGAANTDNIDKTYEKFLEQYFPKEVLAKQIQNEIEDGKQRFGPSYKHPSETTCSIQ